MFAILKIAILISFSTSVAALRSGSHSPKSGSSIDSVNIFRFTHPDNPDQYLHGLIEHENFEYRQPGDYRRRHELGDPVAYYGNAVDEAAEPYYSERAETFSPDWSMKVDAGENHSEPDPAMNIGKTKKCKGTGKQTTKTTAKKKKRKCKPEKLEVFPAEPEKLKVLPAELQEQKNVTSDLSDVELMSDDHPRPSFPDPTEEQNNQDLRIADGFLANDTGIVTGDTQSIGEPAQVPISSEDQKNFEFCKDRLFCYDDDFLLQQQQNQSPENCQLRDDRLDEFSPDVTAENWLKPKEPQATPYYECDDDDLPQRIVPQRKCARNMNYGDQQHSDDSGDQQHSDDYGDQQHSDDSEYDGTSSKMRTNKKRKTDEMFKQKKKTYTGVTTKTERPGNKVSRKKKRATKKPASLLNSPKAIEKSTKAATTKLRTGRVVKSTQPPNTTKHRTKERRQEGEFITITLPDKTTSYTFPHVQGVDYLRNEFRSRITIKNQHGRPLGRPSRAFSLNHYSNEKYPTWKDKAEAAYTDAVEFHKKSVADKILWFQQNQPRSLEHIGEHHLN